MEVVRKELSCAGMADGQEMEVANRLGMRSLRSLRDLAGS